MVDRSRTGIAGLDKSSFFDNSNTGSSRPSQALLTGSWQPDGSADSLSERLYPKRAQQRQEARESGYDLAPRTDTVDMASVVGYESRDTQDGLNRNASPSKHARLIALDIVRGFTIATMIFVDDAGGAYQLVDHSPWNGITLADIVMPWFLFMVGMAMAMSFRKFEGSPEKRWNGLKKLIWRSLKLFLLGVATQGGGFPDPDEGTFGYNLMNVRWCGILQRIAFSYFVVGMIKLYVPTRQPSQGMRYTDGSWADLLKVYAYHWAVVLCFVFLYLGLMFGTKVPSWTIAATDLSVQYGVAGETVECDVRGDVSPACNAAGHYDRMIFGQAHLYQPGEKIRLPECSTCSPGQCWEFPNGTARPQVEMPVWCWAPFDPEGAVASLLTVLTTYIGTHFGHAITLSKKLTPGGAGGGESRRRQQRTLLCLWSISVVACLAVGAATIPAFPCNKQLWSPAYALINAGICGGALVIVYLLCDVLQLQAAVLSLRPLQWMGMNALFVFVMSECDFFSCALNAVYWGEESCSPDPNSFCPCGDDPSSSCRRNLISEMHYHLFQKLLHGSSSASNGQIWDPNAYATLAQTLVKITFWIAVSGVLHWKRWYWKF